MTAGPPPRLAAAIASSLAAGHRFRDDILSDLEAGYQEQARAGGHVAARRWYWMEAMRVPVSLGSSLRVTALAILAYLGVLGADVLGGHVVSSQAWGLGVIAMSSAGAGRLLVRWAGRSAGLALPILWALALAVGVPYIARGSAGEWWLHVAKVLTVLVGSGVGTLVRTEPHRRNLI